MVSMASQTALLFLVSLLVLIVNGGRLAPNTYSRIELARVNASQISYNRLPSRVRMDRRMLTGRVRHGVDQPLGNDIKDGFFYSIKATIGNQQLELVVDTGSDPFWHKCAGYSSPLHCKDPLCFDQVCQNECHFKYGYIGGGGSYGTMVYEQVTLEGGVTLPKVVAGCATSNEDHEVQGVMGLGRGQISILNQSKSMFDSAFSYCLGNARNHFPSYLHLGRDGTPGLSYTTMVGEDYRVQVEEVRVGNEVLPVPLDSLNSQGGTVFDSGCSPSYFHKALVDQLYAAYDRAVRLPKTDGLYCYDITGLNHQQIEAAIPPLSFTFSGGLVFQPPALNVFSGIDARGPNVRCLGILVDDDSPWNIFGNAIQQGFHIENDIKNTRIGFAYTGCRR